MIERYNEFKAASEALDKARAALDEYLHSDPGTPIDRARYDALWDEVERCSRERRVAREAYRLACQD